MVRVLFFTVTEEETRTERPAGSDAILCSRLSSLSHDRAVLCKLADIMYENMDDVESGSGMERCRIPLNCDVNVITASLLWMCNVI